MEIDFTGSFEPKDRKDWRDWLKAFHKKKTEVWLIFYKKHTGMQTLHYNEALEEGICFGWIDGLKKRVDSDRFTYRFTPRKKGSKWSPRNIEIAEKMIRKGKMAEAGMEAYAKRSEYDAGINAIRSAERVKLPDDIRNGIERSPAAWRNYQNMAPGHRKNYILWITSARLDSTRRRRLAETIRRLENNLKPGM